MINLGVKVFIGFTVVSKSLGGPLILKLTPKTPSPTFFPISRSPSKGIEAIVLLIVVAGTKVPLKLISLSSSMYPSNKIEEKINIVDLVLLSKLENSKSEIRRLIKGNAVKINDDVISDEKFEINKNLFKNNYLKLSLGKKRHIKIELN